MSDPYVDPYGPQARAPSLGLKSLLLMLLAMALIFADREGDRLLRARELLATGMAPVFWLASSPVRIGLVADRLQSRESLEQENQRLSDNLLLMQAKLQRLEAIEAENQRLRVLLASSQALEERVLIAEITDINQDPYRHQITLNKGRRDGVYRGQALIDAYGILGQVIEVSAGQSRALLITDPDHGIPVEVNRTGLQTIAVGGGDGQGLRLPFLPTNVDIREGDLLVSSPLGGRFPPGYPVGRIHQLRNTAGAHFLEARAYPSAQLNQGRQALLVWAERQDRDPGDTDADADTAAEPDTNPDKTGDAPAPPAGDSVPPPAAIPTPPGAAPDSSGITR
jgi:rod shape-determining protein MreC